MEFIVIFAILVITALFFKTSGRRDPKNFWIAILLLFLAFWAGRFWFIPAPIDVWGYVLIGVISLAFIIAFALLLPDPRKDEETVETNEDADVDQNEEENISGGRLIWILIIVLIIAIVIGYMNT